MHAPNYTATLQSETFVDLPIMLFKGSVLSLSSVKLSTLPLIISMNCYFVISSYSGSLKPIKLQRSLRAIATYFSNICQVVVVNFQQNLPCLRNQPNKIVRKFDLRNCFVYMLFICVVLKM